MSRPQGTRTLSEENLTNRQQYYVDRRDDLIPRVAANNQHRRVAQTKRLLGYLMTHPCELCGHDNPESLSIQNGIVKCANCRDKRDTLYQRLLGGEVILPPEPKVPEVTKPPKKRRKLRSKQLETLVVFAQHSPGFYLPPVHPGIQDPEWVEELNTHLDFTIATYSNHWRPLEQRGYLFTNNSGYDVSPKGWKQLEFERSEGNVAKLRRESK